MGLPKPLLVVAMTLFVASVLGTLVALGVFFWYDVGFWYAFEVGAVLRVAAAILSLEVSWRGEWHSCNLNLRGRKLTPPPPLQGSPRSESVQTAAPCPA